MLRATPSFVKSVLFITGLFWSLSGLLVGCGGPTQPQSCQSNDDCLSGQICTKKKCVEKQSSGCQSDQDCAAPNPKCNSATGQCQPVCLLNSECPTGYECRSGECVLIVSPECVWDKDCGAGKVCREQKCVVDSQKECYSDKDCETKSLRYCASDNTCAWECRVDSDCGTGRRCIEHVCKNTGECRKDDDCSLPKGRCDSVNKTCVACLNDNDCPKEHLCKQQVCEKKPGCSGDADCQAPKARCDVATRMCYECLTNQHCPTGEACDNRTCKVVPTGCNPACTAGNFCFAEQRCLPEWKPCQEAKDCQANETCLDPGAGKVCLTQCDPTKNTSKDDPTNSACLGGYGFCLGTSQTDATKGVCVPPYQKRREWKETCQNLANPQKADYHDCKDADTLCVDDNGSGVCWKKCDPKKNADPQQAGTNPDCDGGQGTCFPLSQGGGICQPVRPKTQKQDEGCLLTDPKKPDWSDCASGLVCVKNKCVVATQDAGQACNNTDKLCKDGLLCLLFDQATNLALCKASCNPNQPKCPTGFVCEAISFTDPNAGACIDERNKSRNKGEACEGNDPTKPEWHTCTNSAPCVQGKCGEPRPATAKKGDFCELGESTDPTYAGCQSGLRCWSNTCLTACDPTASAPGCLAEETCVVLDQNKPKEGVCRPWQGLDCEPQKQPCPGNYTCFKFNFAYRCTKPCDPTASSSGCAAFHDCQPFDVSNPKVGYCIPQRRPLHKKGGSCYYSRPEDPTYHGCQIPYVCIELACVDAPPATGQEGAPCDAKTGCLSSLLCTASDTGQNVCARPCNPYKTGQCKTGEICIPQQKDKLYWTGGCFQPRTLTQPLGSPCKRNNATRPEYNDCTTGLVCVGSGAETYCRTECNPTAATCPTEHSCIEYTQGKGACLRTRQSTREEDQTCGLGDENDPGYHNCKTGLLCATFDAATQLNLCVKACDPSKTPSTCPNDFRCVGVDFFDPTKGACIRNRTQTRAIGESCDLKDPRNAGYNNCLKDDQCLNGFCVDCTENKHCATGETCRVNQCLGPGACLTNTDCQAPKAKCLTTSRQCVACLVDTDCPAGETCQANACQKLPGCQKDSDCTVPTPKCLVASRKCVSCLVEVDCPVGQECKNNTCQVKPNPTGCSPACTAGNYCFNNERCIPTWGSCTSNSDCKTQELCTRLDSSAVCLPSCDPKKNKSTTDATNPDCYGGYGICLGLVGSTQGVCVPPRKPIRDQGETCLRREQPQNPEYHDCKVGLECWNGKCQTARTKTQPIDGACNRDGTGADHNDCVTTAVCVSYVDGRWCRQTCDTANPKCPVDYDCRALTGGGGVCVKKRQNTRKLGETCGGNDIKATSYDHCATNLTCLSFDSTTGLQLCVQNCVLSNPSCPSNHTCLPLSTGGTQGVCISNRTRTRKENETCGGTDPSKPDWNDCIPGYGCYQNKCIARTQSKGDKCDAEKLLCKEGNACIVLDSSNNLNFCLAQCNPQQSACPRDTTCISTSSTDPTQGACLPNRQTTRKEGETCGANDISQASYNSCVTGLTCMGNTTYGYHCLANCNPDTTNPGCRTGYRCVKLGAGRGACAQTCTAVGTCSYGTVCTDPGTSLGYNICM